MAATLDRIEWIGEAVPASGLRHELCDARGALWAHRTGIETALLPDHASEKFSGEGVLCRRLFQHPANVIGRGWIRSRGLRFNGHSRLTGLGMHRCRRGGARLRIRLPAYQGESTGQQRSDRSSHVGLTSKGTFGAAGYAPLGESILMRAPGPGRPNRRFPGDLKNWVRSIRPGTRWCERGPARRCFFPSDGLRGALVSTHGPAYCGCC